MRVTSFLEIHPWNMAEAHSSAEIPVRGIASCHLVDLSMHVKRYVKPLDEGKGPTRSTCTCANLLKGTGIFSGRCEHGKRLYLVGTEGRTCTSHGHHWLSSSRQTL